ncbi:MAG: hypothetical protein J0H42_09120 [Rhizobiales bacterium]|nr:hypothetical protein [Hyphomicrobiales bacterium]
MSKAIIAFIGAAVGALLIYFGLNFHIGSWWLSGAAAYVPAAIAGAVTALLIRTLLSHR